MTPTRTLSLLLAMPIAIALAGCITIVQAPADEPSAAPSSVVPPVDISADCVVVAQPGLQRFGDCDELVIEGADLEIEAGAIGLITIRGDRIDIDVESAGAVSISGNENEIDLDGDIGEVRIVGDRNDVDVDGELGLVRVSGNDNEVEAEGGIGAVNDNGDRNVFTP